MKKKLLLVFSVLLTGIVALIDIPKVQAETYAGEAIWPSEFISDVYIKKERADGYTKYQQGRFIRRSEDNAFVYCLQPFVDINNNYVYNIAREDYEVYLNMTKEQWQRIRLLAYYGYGYGSHTSTKWYAITQVLIWRTAEPSGDFYFTNGLNGSRNDSLFIDEINEIENLVSNHYKVPNFKETNITLPIGDTITLTDINGVLNNYEITKETNVTANIDNNNLTIKANSIGDGQINLTKTDTKYSAPPIVYFNEHSQNVMRVGAYDPVNSYIKINVIGGKVSINKVDEETGLGFAQGDASLDGAIYGIYKEDGTRVGQLESVGGKYVTSDYLPSLGRYYILEEKASIGYELNNTKYYFEITEDNLNPQIEVTEKVIKRDLEIFKVFASGETGILIGESNITFDIYLKSTGEKVQSITTDKNGYATATLPYGTYIIKQVNTTDGYEKVDDFEIVVNDEIENPIYKLLSNADVTARLKVIKVDADTGETIAMSGIKFKIFDLNKNDYVCQITNVEQCIFETDENGILLTPLPLESGSYRLEEVDQSLNGYLWNSEGLEFTISNNTDLINDEVFGAILEIKFANQEVKGTIEINKIGEDLVIKDDSYIYEEIALPNVEFGLYDENGNLITKVTTDDNGYAKIENLKLGKYILKELVTNGNHILDINEYEVILEYKDQYTPIITKTFILKNYLAKGGLDFTKTDLVTGEALPNTKIEIFTEDNIKIFEGVTDENGKITIDNLPIGKFYIIESEAPDGYILNTEKMWFEITEDGQIIKANMTNELVVEVPNTGISDSNILNIIGIVVIILGIGYITYDKFKKK